MSSPPGLARSRATIASDRSIPWTGTPRAASGSADQARADSEFERASAPGAPEQEIDDGSTTAEATSRRSSVVRRGNGPIEVAVVMHRPTLRLWLQVSLWQGTDDLHAVATRDRVQVRLGLCGRDRPAEVIEVADHRRGAVQVQLPAGYGTNAKAVAEPAGMKMNEPAGQMNSRSSRKITYSPAST